MTGRKRTRIMGYLQNGGGEMTSELTGFYKLRREIFGICPECGDFFRLSDCNIYLKERPKLDWLDKLNKKNENLEKKEEAIEEIKERLRAKGRAKGLQLAKRTIRQIDPIFTPRMLDPDDAKVIFHPVDYVVFKGMSNDRIRDVMFLDREASTPEHAKLQESLRNAIREEEYGWQTLRIREDGDIDTE